MVYNWLASGRPWLTGRCQLCLQTTPWRQDFCQACERTLPFVAEGCCRCAAPLPGLGLDATSPVLTCGQCQRQSPHFDRTLALFHYQPPVDRLIQDLKYNSHLHLARILGETFLDKLIQPPGPATVAQRIDLLMPIPLHPSRMRRRGYNQALELARPLARHFGLPLDYRSLRRIRATPAQTDLPLAQRRSNVRGAFALHPPALNTQALKGKRIALIDDVMTTGHTVNEAAACLRRAGVSEIEVWVIGRA